MIFRVWFLFIRFRIQLSIIAYIDSVVTFINGFVIAEVVAT